MDDLLNKETAILGLLCEKSMYGYEIEMLISQRGMRYWTEISFSSIYKVLNKLEKKKLVTSKIKLMNNRLQKIFTVTEEGRKVMKQRIKELFSAVEKTIWQIDLALSNSYMLSKSEILKCLDSYIESIDQRLTVYKELLRYFEKSNYSEGDCALAIRPMMHLEVEKKWAVNFKNKIRGGKKW